MSFRPHASKPDWFVAPLTWFSDLQGVPGLVLSPSVMAVHRSHLPLLSSRHPEVRGFIDRSCDRTERDRLDAACEPLGYKLRDYQHEAREFVLGRRGTLLALQMRLGKTCVAVTSHDPASGCLFVVAPLAARQVWTTWMNRRFPDEPVEILTGKTWDPSRVQNKKLVFCHYDILRFWQSSGFKTKIGTIVFDEAHLLSSKGTASKRTQAAYLLCGNAERVITATGTPLWNRPYDMWPILMCTTAGGWGTRSDFGRRYADPQIGTHGTKYAGASNVEEFRERLTEVMIRRTWREVLTELPAIERNVEVVELKQSHALQLDTLLETLRVPGDVQTRIGEMARIRRLLGSIKAPVAVEATASILDGGESVVLWAWHRDVAHAMAQALADLGHRTYTVTGEENDQTQRDRILDAWRGEIRPSALVCTISVGQVAIDLSHARHCVFAEVDFTPTTVAQAEMRTFAATRPMTVTYIVADHPVDQALVGALLKKCELGESIGVPAAEASIECLADAFGLNPERADLSRLMGAFLASCDDE